MNVKVQIIKRDADLNEPYDREIIHNDILDHYLIFNKLEQYLQTPTRLKEQLVFQITNEMADKLIEKYLAIFCWCCSVTKLF
jgi:hypothetical protein